jgi:hypothetical protein
MPSASVCSTKVIAEFIDDQRRQAVGFAKNEPAILDVAKLLAGKPRPVGFFS